MTGCGAGHRPFEQDERVHGKPPNPDCVSSMLTASLPDHARMRRVLDHAFSSKAFQEQQPVIESYVKKLIGALRKEVDSSSRGRVDLVKWFNWTTFDIVGDFSFGESFNCIENRNNHPWLNTVFGNLKVITFIGISNRFTIFRKLLPHLIPKHAKEETKRHFAYLDERITRRMELGADRPDFITPMLKNNNDGKGLTPAEIRANMGLMVVAGSESVVTVTCGAIYYMLKNPATMARLTEEIRSAFPSEAEITPQRVLQLNYLTAIINEALRLYPSTPGLPACRVPPEGSMVSGEWVAGNVSLLLLPMLRLTLASPSVSRVLISPPDRRLHLPVRRLPLRAQLHRPRRLHPGPVARRPALRLRPARCLPPFLQGTPELYRQSHGRHGGPPHPCAHALHV